MSDRKFWGIIKLLDWSKAGDDDAVVEPLISHLAGKKDDVIFSFEDALARKLHALDTKSHAMSIGEDAYVNDEEFFSVDGFLYSRCVVVANGKKLFENVLRYPETFPKDMEFEALLYTAQKAFERKNDTPWQHDSSVSYETFANVEGWK